MPLVKKMKKVYLALCILLFVGCSSVSLHEVSKEYYQGDSQKAFKYALRESKDSKDSLLYQMMGGVIGFQTSSPKALQILEEAERKINANERSGMLRGFFEGMGAVMINDNVMPYRGYLYEGVMINYYKALLYMQGGDLSNARVEFNRANDRQRRLKDYYKSEINQASQEKSKIQSKNLRLDQEEKILSGYSNLSRFWALEEYINPMVSYVSGLFFMLQRDSKGIDLLKEAYAITSNPIIKEDFLMAQRGIGNQKFTWVLIEDGYGAWKIQKGFSLPIFTIDSVFSVSLALPDLKEGKDFEKSYHVKLAQESIKAQKVGNLDPLIYNEFSKHLPLIVTRSILSATSKALAQHYMQKSASGMAKVLLSIGGMAYAIASTQADLRSNRILPHSFWVARIENKVGDLKLLGEREMFVIQMREECDKENQLCVGKNNIIYFRNAGKNIFHQIVLEH